MLVLPRTRTLRHGCHTTIDRFYDFIKGENLLGRKPEPPIRVVQEAEREAWRKIVHTMHSEKIGSKAAMDRMTQNQMFWSREVIEKLFRNGDNQRQPWNDNQNRGQTEKG